MKYTRGNLDPVLKTSAEVSKFALSTTHKAARAQLHAPPCNPGLDSKLPSRTHTKKKKKKKDGESKKRRKRSFQALEDFYVRHPFSDCACYRLKSEKGVHIKITFNAFCTAEPLVRWPNLGKKVKLVNRQLFVPWVEGK